jgi:hypothetical protein
LANGQNALSHQTGGFLNGLRINCRNGSAIHRNTRTHCPRKRPRPNSYGRLFGLRVLYGVAFLTNLPQWQKTDLFRAGNMSANSRAKETVS